MRYTIVLFLLISFSTVFSQQPKIPSDSSLGKHRNEMSLRFISIGYTRLFYGEKTTKGIEFFLGPEFGWAPVGDLFFTINVVQFRFFMRNPFAKVRTTRLYDFDVGPFAALSFHPESGPYFFYGLVFGHSLNVAKWLKVGVDVYTGAITLTENAKTVPMLSFSPGLIFKF